MGTVNRNFVSLSEERIRDACVLADADSETYYLVTSSRRRGPNGRPAVAAYLSQDLVRWERPRIAFEVPEDFWAQRGIWAPELHRYRGKYYLFLTFNTEDLLPEQWRNWRPRVKRGSQVLVSDSPLGPFEPFANHSTLPPDMMTLDGTLWVEDGVPYMVFCHEWVQIKDGTMQYIRLSDDLSKTVGEPAHMFHGSDALWNTKGETTGEHVTDGPWLHVTRTGKLVMLWSGFRNGTYTVGVASSASGTLAGPWSQQAEPLFTQDGGHPMMFRTFDDRLMMIVHQPNRETERARLFEMDDHGDTVRIVRPFPEAAE